ncbi:DUF262 domain-containing protein [Shewanella algae]|uniref:DUF262 domain-containing protein n=1 Tax=Shewanella algae TaxID=38313 RepID=UPI0005CDBB59|nr:DUF262 domain-containing protein [Shewanella algae]MBO2605696.1 DUF262 domain-containing protein [Shewanella algae]
MMKTAAMANPGSTYIDDLINFVITGEVRVPAFQRGYVWKERNIIELFESIYLGYPIGSILLWETNSKINVRESFGVKESKDKKVYIIDGQQRVTTLFYCLSGSRSNEDLAKLCEVYFDLEREEFVHADGEPRPDYFPVSKLLNTLEFLKETKRLLESTGNIHYVEKAEILANKIRKYKISTIDLVGNTLDEAIEIFTRLNKTGLKIDAVEMISALNYQQDEESFFQICRRSLQEYTERYRFIPLDKEVDNFGDVFIKLIRISLGFQLYAKDDTEKVAQLVKSEEFGLIYVKISESYRISLEFLVEELNFKSIYDLPYINILYMVYIFFFSGQSDVLSLKTNLYRGSISGLFNTNPSGTDNLINYFKSGFETKFLTNKFIAKLSDDSCSNFLEEVKGGSFNAKSAVSKVIYNIVLNFYISKGGDSEFLYYPPFTLYPGVDEGAYKNYLGNKSFFSSVERDMKSNIFDGYYSGIDILGSSQVQLIKVRNNAYYDMVDSFLLNNNIYVAKI